VCVCVFFFTEPEVPDPSNFVVSESSPATEEPNKAVSGRQTRSRTRQAKNSQGTSETKEIKCDLCSATFTRHGNFKRHRKIHTVNLKVFYIHLLMCVCVCVCMCVCVCVWPSLGFKYLYYFLINPYVTTQCGSSMLTRKEFHGRSD
jgi:hypothetical protein